MDLLGFVAKSRKNYSFVAFGGEKYQTILTFVLPMM